MLDVQNIRKEFQSTVAVDSISFTIQKGDIYGFLGPNGAGKTTTLRMLMGIIEPDEGTILLNGEAINRLPRNLFGYLPEERGLYQKQKLFDTLLYLGSLKGENPSGLKPEIERWLERFDLTDYAQRNLRELSKGNQQKVQFIATLLHHPQFIILDEPFTGLDPINQLLLKEIIQEFREEGATILFSTHQMEQVERLCNKICLINRGNIILEGSLRDVQNKHKKEYAEVTYSGSLDHGGLENYLDSVKTKDDTITGILKTTSHTFLDWLNERVEVQSYVVNPPDLEQIFIEEVRGQEAGGAA